MIDEEKKAIEFLDTLKDYYKSQAESINKSLNKEVYKDEYEVYLYRSEQLTVALNLIQKQEQVINLMSNTMEKDTIWKDKIREKIKELEELSNNVTMQPQIYSYIIKVLEELLENKYERAKENIKRS